MGECDFAQYDLDKSGGASSLGNDLRMKSDLGGVPFPNYHVFTAMNFT